MKYVPLDAILNYIPRSVRVEEDNDTLLKSWMLQAMKMLNIPQQYQAKVSYIAVKNHKAQLPEDLTKIEYVGVCDKKVNVEEEVKGLCHIQETTEPKVIEQSDCKYPLYYRMFLDDYFSMEKYPPMDYIYNVDSDYLLCKDCLCRNLRQGYRFTISKEMVLTTDLLEGTIIVLYKAPVKDENGDYMIPDIEKLKKALARYAEAAHWENRMAVHEDGAFRIYDLKRYQSEVSMRAARGASILRMADASKISDVVRSKIMSYYGSNSV